MTDLMKTDENPKLEVDRRLKLEMDKALAKYGEAALAPGGHPDLNIADFMLNELVGLIRYGAMLEVRAQAWNPITRALAESVAQRCVRYARRDAENLARIVLALSRHGVEEGLLEAEMGSQSREDVFQGVTVPPPEGQDASSEALDS